MNEHRKPLFGPDPDLNEIEEALGPGWEKFSLCARMPMGIPKLWTAAVYELSDLFAHYEQQKRDDTLLYRALYFLLERTAVLPNRDEFRRQFQVTFGLILEGNAVERALSPAARERARKQRWLDNYWAKATGAHSR